TLAVPAAMSCQNRFDDGDIASIVELPENRQPLLGTEEHASSRPSRNVTIERQLELCGASRVQDIAGWRALPELAGEIEGTCEPGSMLTSPIQESEGDAP